MSMTIEPTKTDKKISPYPFMPPTRKVTWETNVRSVKHYRAYLAMLNLTDVMHRSRALDDEAKYKQA